MGRKYIVCLTDEEREEFIELVNKGNAAAYEFKHMPLCC